VAGNFLPWALKHIFFTAINNPEKIAGWPGPFMAAILILSRLGLEFTINNSQL
jgi:hypothetical protein